MQSLGDYFGGRASQLLVDLPFIPVFVAMIALIGGVLAVVSLAILCLFSVVSLSVGLRLREGVQKVERQEARIQDFFADVFDGITAAKAMAMEPQLLRRFERLQQGLAGVNRDHIQVATQSQANLLMLGNVSMVAMVTAGAVLAVTDTISLGTLSACTLLSGRVIQPVLSAVALWNEVQRTRLALVDVQAVFALPAPALAPVVRSAAPPEILFDRILCHTDSPSAFAVARLQIRPGELVVFTGDDGNGKDVMLKLLVGATTACSGTILVDGKSDVDFRARSPGAIAFVGQRSQFFRGSLLDNLTLFGRGPGAEQARQAASLIGLDHSVNRLPLGFDTRLGEGIAETLPAGLLRQLAIARAIASAPAILLLDEPQVSLDVPADYRLLQGLAAFKRRATILIATSRPSYFALADLAFRCVDGGLHAIAPTGVAAAGGAGTGKLGEALA